MTDVDENYALNTQYITIDIEDIEDIIMMM